MKKLLILLFLVASTAQAGTLSNADIQREVFFDGLMVLDYAQTKDIKHYPTTAHERNKLLGEHPSDAAIRNYFLVTAAGHYLVTKTLPAAWRPAWQYGFILLEAVTVYKNKRIGLQFSY